MTRGRVIPFDADIQTLYRWSDAVTEAASAFERRWTRRALRRVNADLADRLEEQLALFHAAKITGEAHEIEAHGPATCRGWQAAVRTMEEAKEPDDAYIIGFDPKSGVKVAIGEKPSSAGRVAELHGERVVWMTPDEVATMFAAIEGFKAISAIKAKFPGAEVVDMHGDFSPAA